jgi:uncharacterized protein
MALLEDQLVVKRSSLPGAGKGLFTRKFIAKGALIVEYKGRVTTWKEIKDRDYNNGYIFYVKRDRVINAAPYKAAVARFANDARGIVRVKGISNNAYYNAQNSRVYITATKDIPARSEIFVDYGKEYWDAIRHNRKIDAAKARK